MIPTPLDDELESARKAYLDAESHWRSLLRRHDIDKYRAFIGKFFYGYIHDRDCTRYFSVTDVDVNGRLVGDIITFWDGSVEFAPESTIRDDIDTMDEISASEYIDKLSGFSRVISAVITRLGDNLAA